MNEQAITCAAAQFYTARNGDDHFDTLAADCIPATLDEGYAIQAAYAAQLGIEQLGWKIAATSEAGQTHIDVPGPIIGRLFADRVFPSPARLLMRQNRMRVAEAEFTFRFGLDVPAATDWTPESLFEYVDALFPAIELPDSRFTDFVNAGAPCLVADNACARDYILGEEVTGRWRDIAFDRYRVHVSVNGEKIVTGVGADVLGDPRLALTWMANECGRLGYPINRGQMVTTGVMGRPVPIRPGDHVVADFGLLGQVEVTFE